MGGKRILAGAAVALVSAGVAAGGVYWWQRGIVDDTENRLQSALDAGQDTWTAFLRALRHPQPWQTSLTDSPYWMTIEDGLLVRMVEQYQP